MMRITSLLLFLLLPGVAFSNSETVTVRSAGNLQHSITISLAEQLLDSDEQQIEKPSRHTSGGTGHTASRELALHSTPSLFELFDAWVELDGDLDADGYYHHLKVSFDADVLDDSQETVYAKIYLDQYDGHWFQIATTDLFEIESDSALDTYQNLTELVEGFPPGDYRVLIELHSLSHPYDIAQTIVSLDRDGYLITLEDLEYDRPAHSGVTIDSVEIGVSGGLSLTGLIVGLVLLGVRSATTANKMPRYRAC